MVISLPVITLYGFARVVLSPTSNVLSKFLYDSFNPPQVQALARIICAIFLSFTIDLKFPSKRCLQLSLLNGFTSVLWALAVYLGKVGNVTRCWTSCDKISSIVK